MDLGSNTARLVVYAYHPALWYRLEDEIREPVRLGEGLGWRGELSPAAMDRAAAALKLFADYRTATRLDHLEVIATSALRDASNRKAFFARVGSLDLPIQIVGGDQEARLSVTAVANGFTMGDAWVMDLGGGSAQISRMEARVSAEGEAYPLGAVRLTEAFLRSDPPRPAEVASLERRVEKELGRVAKAIRSSGLPLVVLGGTIRNLARAVQERRGYSMPLLHGYVLKRDDLEELVDDLLGMSAKKRARVRGINQDRADVILAGALVYRWLLRSSRLDHLLVSGYGVREGRFFQAFLPSPHRLQDPRGFGVANLRHQYRQQTPHVEKVRHLAGQLFERLASLHDLGRAEADILDAAAALHDIGMAVGYHRHHKHGAYLLESTPLAGFSHREQALITLLVRYHRKGTPKTAAHRDVLQRGDGRLLKQLAICLRLAEQLERARAGRVLEVRPAIGKRVVRLGLVATEEPHLELTESRKHADLFRKAFDRRLRVHRVR